MSSPRDQSSRNPVIENVKSVDLLRSRNVAYPWTGETHFRVTPDAQSKSVFCTSARILVPVSDVNPMAIADSGASHVILPVTALNDDKSAKKVNLRLAAGEMAAVEAYREIFAEHVTIPLLPSRTSDSQAPAYCYLDSQDFDIKLCEQIWHSAWLDAMSHQGRYSLFHCGSILDVTPCFATPA